MMNLAIYRRGKRVIHAMGDPCPPQSGVTLVELMFAILIFAVLLAIAVPSFRDASLGARLSAIANSLHGTIQIARSEAIKANVPITLCTSTDGSTCATTGTWEQGWVVRNATGGIYHSEPAQPPGFRVIEATGLRTLTFQPIGVTSSSASFKVCRQTPVGKQERVVSMTGTAIAYVTTTEVGTCP
jgi:type IV fimbrial biogenesis protein FimT